MRLAGGLRGAATIAALLAVAATGCGTRQDHAAVVAAAQGSRDAVELRGFDASGPSDAAETDEAVGLADGATGSSASDVDRATAARRDSRASSGRASAVTNARSGPAAGTKSPVKVASVGTLSGPVGAVLIGNVHGLQVWVKAVTARGGLNGHPIQLTVVDDGADPARHRAAVQEMIEQQGVVAFLNNPEVLSGESSVDYITSKRVPVIGSETGGQWFYRSPMYFPQASHGDALLYLAIASTAQQSVPQGKRKFGIVTCQESTFCRKANAAADGIAKSVGFEPVYKGQASLAQPDFTAECLAARSAGVEAFQIVLDTNSVQRVAAACARQQFHPIFAIGASLVTDQLKNNPNLAGMVASSNVFPYFQQNTPATAEFQAAMKTYAPGRTPGVAEATGWTSGKLFEKVTANLPEPPTSAAILDGLWSIKNDNLGGLTSPITFIKNRPPPVVTCWFNIAIRKNAWVSPDRYQLHCT